ncbi:glucose-6-phosphate isomerase [bacterium]|nr:glucose-6-phosphate isomerase [bacterium]
MKAQGFEKGIRGAVNGLQLDVNNMMADIVGPDYGITMEMIKAVGTRISLAHRKIEEMRKSGGLCFTDLPYQEKGLDDIINTAARISDEYENFVLLGIGGSALGPIAIHSALQPDYYNMLPAERRGNRPKFFFLDNIDPARTGMLLELLDDNLKGTFFNVVTKSGGTAETLANFLIFRDKLRQRLGTGKLSDHFIVTTDPESGTLREIALEENYPILPIPKGVGGRFSVFTPVGLFPSAVTGIDIHSLLAGARHMDELCRIDDIWENPAYLKGVLDYIAHVSMGKTIQVMMPYSHRLRDLADWYRQLWAESLGKRYNLEGEEVWAGTTPVSAIGATDQHSQLQLYLEGPNDKVITFIAVKQYPELIKIPEDFHEKKGISYLGGHTLNELFDAERMATQFALMKAGRMTSTITLNEISSYTLGGLLYFFEMETAFAGFLYGINPFDQPGVEEGKRATYDMMGRPGFEGKKDEVKRMIECGKPQYIINALTMRS